ncbi:MAG: tetratricopeptide repeat protein, partial [Deltaproteobacteria bacterium]|nr:tetratricopeptide repeat protein [Deltaproteobacteria bacterium]
MESKIYSRKTRFFSGPFFICGLILALFLGACATAYKPYDVDLNPSATAAENLASQGDYEKALAKYEEALRIYEREGNEQGKLFCLERMGWFQREVGDYGAALQSLERAYPLGERLNGDAAEIDANLGDVYLFTGDFKQARVHYEQTLETLKDFVFKTSYRAPPGSKEISNIYRKTKAIIHARDNLGTLSYFSGEYEEALDHLKKAEELIKKVWIVANHSLYGMFFKVDSDIYEGSGFCYTVMGAVYAELGDLDRADAYFEEGKKAFEKGKKSFGLLVNNTVRFKYEPFLNDDATRAEAFHSNGDYDQALAMFRKALTVYEQEKNERGVLYCLERMGWLQREIGFYGEALRMFRKAHPIGVKLNGDAAEIDADLGDVFLFSGDTEKAREHYQRALDTLKGFVFETAFAQPPSREDILSMIRKATALIHARENLGTLHYFEGQYDEALKNLKLAEGLINKVWDVLKHPIYGKFFIFAADFYEGVGFYHTITGAVYGETGRFDRAWAHFRTGKDVLTKGNRPFGLLMNEALRFKIEFLSPDVTIDEKKFMEYERFLEKAEGLGAQEIIWRMCFEIGRALAREKEYEKARSYLTRAIDVLELTRSRLREDTIKKMFASSVQDVYAEMIELLFEMKQYEEGFNYLERAKARAFLDMLAGRSVKAKKTVDPLLIEREKAVQKQIDIIGRQLRKLKVKGKKKLFSDYKKLLAERKNILEAIKG